MDREVTSSAIAEGENAGRLSEDEILVTDMVFIVDKKGLEGYQRIHRSAFSRHHDIWLLPGTASGTLFLERKAGSRERPGFIGIQISHQSGIYYSLGKFKGGRSTVR